MAKDNKDKIPAAIKTVEQLREAYPELVKIVIDDGIEWFKNRTAAQIKDGFPEIYKRIADSLKPKDLLADVRGFRLDIGDPFALGTLRAFMSEKRIEDLKLPYVLPYNDVATRTAVASYILRATGGGRKDLADKARAEIKKCK